MKMNRFARGQSEIEPKVTI